jgi:4-hydroxybenzoate polyprenyltransferase
MHYIKKLHSFFESLVILHIYYSFGLSLLALAFSLLLGFPLSFEVFLFVFLVSYAMHAINKVTDLDEDKINNPIRVSFVIRHYNRIIQSIILTLLLVLVMAVLYIRILPVLLVIILFGGIYSIRFIPSKNKRIRLKDIPLVKTLTVAMCYILATLFIPLIFFLGSYTLGLIILLFFTIGRTFINNTLFDLRDIVGDKRSNIMTLPVLFGRNVTLNLIFCVLLFLFLLVNLAIFFGLLPLLAISLNVSLIYVLLIGSKRIDQKFLFEKIIDGEFIFLGVVVLFASMVI